MKCSININSSITSFFFICAIIFFFAHSISPASAGVDSWSCETINAPHDPKPVRNYLRGFVAATGYTGNYQNAAGIIGALCEQHPDWTLGDAANHWAEELGPRNAGGNSTSVNQQQIQQKQIIINVNPNISQ